MANEARTLFLCAGLQSSGTTLISWCFLQRRDMDGILDASSTKFADISGPLTSLLAWVKTTISSFRITEQIAHFEDLGWTVRPLLICRDVREAYASLRTKRYGRNGTTAEDPPLRLRFRRFLEDWDLFRHMSWPILRFDQLLSRPENTLRAACTDLGLEWDEAMLTWPKPKSAILDTRYGNETFNRSRANDLQSTLGLAQKDKKPLTDLIVPRSELSWLEQEFALYNQVNGYPTHVAMQPASPEEEDSAVPCFSASRRFAKQQRSPFNYCLQKITQWLPGKLL